uniref:Sushi domain-containing protein n=1 Tax=Acrobeloides nanus TaxID=290746 RepID=A0A914CGB7_9BILA
MWMQGPGPFNNAAQTITCPPGFFTGTACVYIGDAQTQNPTTTQVCARGPLSFKVFCMPPSPFTFIEFQGMNYTFWLIVWSSNHDADSDADAES